METPLELFSLRTSLWS